MTRLAELGLDLQRRLAGTLGAGEVERSTPVRRLQDDWGDYARVVTSSTLTYYRDLADAVRTYGERVAGVEPSDASASEPVAGGTRPAPQGPEATSRLELRGRLGTVLTTEVTLENHDPDPAEVRVRPGVAVTSDGRVVTPPLAIEPAVLTLPAASRRPLALRLVLLPELFAPGVHTVPIHLEGRQPSTIELVVTVEAGEARAVGEARADTPPADAGGDRDPSAGYHVRCGACGRTFERTTPDLRLRPHKTPDGAVCPERDGTRAS